MTDFRDCFVRSIGSECFYGLVGSKRLLGREFWKPIFFMGAGKQMQIISTPLRVDLLLLTGSCHPNWTLVGSYILRSHRVSVVVTAHGILCSQRPPFRA